jgi:hypothetical protein
MTMRASELATPGLSLKIISSPRPNVRRSVIRALSVVAIFVMAGCAMKHEQWILVPDASLQEASGHAALSSAVLSNKNPRLDYNDREFVVTGHRIAEGQSVVIAFRGFDSGGPLSVDQAQFSKITVVIPRSDLRAGAQIKFPNTAGAMAYYSASSSAFPGAGGCFGYASGGTIGIVRISLEQTAIDVDLRFRLNSPSGQSSQCKEHIVSGVFTASKISVNELTPWQGRAGKGIYEESMK